MHVRGRRGLGLLLILGQERPPRGVDDARRHGVDPYWRELGGQW
jgi:hypothetical protein